MLSAGTPSSSSSNLIDLMATISPVSGRSEYQQMQLTIENFNTNLKMNSK
jgi:hypothetical protein